MTQKQIFYSTDFEATLKADELGFAKPFEILFFAAMRRRFFMASYDGEKFTNCRKNADGTLTVYFDHHNMGIGTLRMQRKYSSTSALYADGKFDLVTPPEQPTFIDSEGEYNIIMDVVNSTTYDAEPEPEPIAELSCNSLTLDAAGEGESAVVGDITILSTKNNDVITVSDSCELPEWMAVALKDTNTNTHTYAITCNKTDTLSGRSFDIVFVNSQGVEVTATVTQLDAVIASYSQWSNISLGNADATVGYASQTLALKAASATCSAIYNNGCTQTITATPVWSAPQGSFASVSADQSKVNIAAYIAQTNDNRSAVITATFAAKGMGNMEVTRTFTITQTVKPVISIVSTLSAISAGETKTLDITTYGAVGTLSVKSSNTAVATVSLSGKKVTIVVSKNSTLTTLATRTATITVEGKSDATVITSATCALTQAKPARTAIGAWQLTISPTTAQSIGYAANTQAVQISATASRTDTYDNGLTKQEEGTPTWSSSANWATPTDGYVSVDECARVASSRTATITASIGSGTTLVSKYFTISQAVKPEIVLSKTSISSASAGGTQTFTVTKYGAVGTLSVSSSNTAVATASISGSTVTVNISAHETLSARTATITVTDGTRRATCSVSQAKAELYLYYGHSADIPESIDTTNSVKLVNGASVYVETDKTNKHKCHWVAAKSTATFSIKSWLDKLETDLNAKGTVKTTTVGSYKVFYILSAGYIINSSRITLN